MADSRPGMKQHDRYVEHRDAAKGGEDGTAAPPWSLLFCSFILTTLPSNALRVPMTRCFIGFQRCLPSYAILTFFFVALLVFFVLFILISCPLAFQAKLMLLYYATDACPFRHPPLPGLILGYVPG